MDLLGVLLYPFFLYFTTEMMNNYIIEKQTFRSILVFELINAEISAFWGYKLLQNLFVFACRTLDHEKPL